MNSIITEKIKILQEKHDFSETYVNNLEKILQPSTLDNDVEKAAKVKFFENYSSLQNDTQKLEFVLAIHSKGIMAQEEAINNIKNNYYLREKNTQKFTDFLEKSETGIDYFDKIGTAAGERLKKDGLISSIGGLETTVSALQMYQNIAVIWNTNEALNVNSNLTQNEINHPELRSIISAFYFGDTDKMNQYFEYHKSLGEAKGFIKEGMTADKYAMNVVQAAICYSKLEPEFKKNLRHVPMHELVPMLNKPFMGASWKFSFNENNNDHNFINPKSLEENLVTYTSQVISEYHFRNIELLQAELKDNNNGQEVAKNFKDVLELYYAGKTPNSKLEKKIEASRLAEQQTAALTFELSLKETMDLLDKSKIKKEDKGLRFKVNNLDSAPNNSVVISSLILGNQEIKKAKDLSLGIHLKEDNINGVNKLIEISDALITHFRESPKHGNLYDKTLIDQSIFRLQKFKKVDFKYLLKEEVFNEPIKIGEEEKTVGEWLLESGKLKRNIKEGLDYEANRDGNKLNSKTEAFIASLDKGVDKIFTNVSTKKWNNEQENYNNLTKHNLEAGGMFLSSKSNLNDYTNLQQNEVVKKTLTKFCAVTAKIVAGKTTLFFDELLAMGKKVFLRKVGENYIENNIGDMKVTPNKSDDFYKFKKDLSKSSNIYIWTFQKVLRAEQKRVDEKFAERTERIYAGNDNSINDLYVANHKVDVASRISKFSQKQEEVLGNNRARERRL